MDPLRREAFRQHLLDRCLEPPLLPLRQLRVSHLRRELSGSDARPGGWVILRGERAPIVGRVTMNLTMVDVTAIPGVHIGDEVVVLGDGITADDHARLAGTIPYEILCAVRAE